MFSQIVPTLDQVIGQTRAVAVLRTAIDSFFYDRMKATEEMAFPHLMISGPAGKTLLSETVARECGSTLHTELAQVALYRALEERKLFLGKKHVVNLPPFCLIEYGPVLARPSHGFEFALLTVLTGVAAMDVTTIFVPKYFLSRMTAMAWTRLLASSAMSSR